MKNGRYEEYGQIRWYKDDLLHREDGPAIEWANGDKEWWVNGLLHRLDGPAIQWAGGYRAWYIDGKRLDIMAVIGYEPSVPLTVDQQMILRLST